MPRLCRRLQNLGTNFGQFKATYAGSVSNNMNLDSTDMQMAIDCDFPFNEDALKTMGEVLLSYPNLKPTNDLSVLYNKAMNLLIGKEKWAKASGEIAQSGSLKKVLAN